MMKVNINRDELEKKMMEMCADRYREGACDFADMMIEGFNNLTSTRGHHTPGEVATLIEMGKKKFLAETNL